VKIRHAVADAGHGSGAILRNGRPPGRSDGLRCARCTNMRGAVLRRSFILPGIVQPRERPEVLVRLPARRVWQPCIPRASQSPGCRIQASRVTDDKRAEIL
jgi:hypothetical protein